MTHVTIMCDGGYTKVQIAGHAGFGYDNGFEEGHDIVCAAVSMLGQTLAQCMMDMSEQKKVVLNTLGFKPGNIHIRAVARNDCISEMETMLKTIAVGYRLLSTAHPEYVQLGCWIRERISGMVYAYGEASLALGKDREKNDSRERPWKGEEHEKMVETESENV